ncbi:urea ABC transporter permease subunit UrtB [Aquibacillus koreensis]|uniref:Urea ABC transporter permease subunit UrtB n=1 Tax=Aquibacillus koreensis TaxID=279446 RepID=A0A9X3WP81_9BACI|nr:urea ABC transporter permease subunit UrtB [Aquibacillus koreensis]MCT2534173.1 urea ABC transporter permease subunit UrtB [Aquibacillus koreensis]MDC3422565.1 urea ABC transporter permease subunit UrtB [Aquibacillus koreensis]
MSELMLTLFNGASLGSILLLIALGLAITFGLMNVINMAHGELIMIGAYVTYVMQNLFISYLPSQYFDFYFILAIPVALLVAAGFGMIMEFSLIRFLYKRPLDSLLATWGVGLMLQQLARSIFGAPNVGVKSPSFLNGGLEVGTLLLPYSRLFILGLSITCLIGIYYYFYRTASGRRVRAVMQNRQMAECLGVSTRKVDLLTFAIGSGFAGVAGCAITLLGAIGPALGTSYIIDAFMVVVVGGVGALFGAVAGAFGIGFFNTAFEYLTNASIGKVLIFLLIIAFLQWRPSGLVTSRSRSLD